MSAREAREVLQGPVVVRRSPPRLRPSGSLRARRRETSCAPPQATARPRGEAAHECRNTEYDHIVVGAGSAGCAVVRRLVDAGRSVLLIETGGRDDNPAIHDPGRQWELWNSPQGAVLPLRLLITSATCTDTLRKAHPPVCDPEVSHHSNTPLELRLYNTSRRRRTEDVAAPFTEAANRGTFRSGF